MLWLQKSAVSVQMKELKRETFSDRELISAIKDVSGTDAALRFLYQEHFDFLSRYVLNNSGSEQDAEDIFQEVMVAFINLVRAGKFRGESTVRTFLFSLNKNIWLNDLKRRGRTEARELRYEKQNDQQDATADVAMELSQTKAQLMQAIESLGENCRKILLLFYFENRSMKEMLAHLPYENEQVVRNKKSKCLKKLEEIVTTDKTLYHQLKTFLYG